ncbi:hypothetical protein EDB84DRAFT_1441243 [Lactarius hengduanensis]|nr:hypothetical protein EDB84DRAFT_1441243 [Lactarius hengduanensis]
MYPVSRASGSYDGPRRPALSSWSAVVKRDDKRSAEPLGGRKRTGEPSAEADSTVAWLQTEAFERALERTRGVREVVLPLTSITSGCGGRSAGQEGTVVPEPLRALLVFGKGGECGVRWPAWWQGPALSVVEGRNSGFLALGGVHLAIQRGSPSRRRGGGVDGYDGGVGHRVVPVGLPFPSAGRRGCPLPEAMIGPEVCVDLGRLRHVGGSVGESRGIPGVIPNTRPLSGQDDVDGERWLELIRLFGGARTFRVAGDLAPDVVRALGPANRVLEAVLPSLRNLYVQDSGPLRTSSREDVVSLITWRRLSGCPISVGYMQLSEPPVYLCLNCDIGLTQHQIISGHTNDRPDARIRCHFCHRFTFSQGRPHLYQEHLRRRHPDVAPPKCTISDRMRDSSPDLHGIQHKYPFAPIVSKRTDTKPHISWLRIPKIAESQRGGIEGSPLCGRPLAPSLGPAFFPEDAWLLCPPTASVFGKGMRINCRKVVPLPVQSVARSPANQ